MKTEHLDYFKDIAQRTALLSHAKRKKVGAIVVKDNRIISIGYNGTPAGWDNCCEVDDVTIPEVIHAEENAIGKLAKSNESADQSTMFTTYSPCLMCAKLIHVSGIKRVYYCEAYRDTYPIEFLGKLGIEVHQI